MFSLIAPPRRPLSRIGRYFLWPHQPTALERKPHCRATNIYRTCSLSIGRLDIMVAVRLAINGHTFGCLTICLNICKFQP